MSSNFLDRFSKNNQVTNFMKIRPVGAELFPADNGRTDRYDDANNRFQQFWERAELIFLKVAHSAPCGVRTEYFK